MPSSTTWASDTRTLSVHELRRRLHRPGDRERKPDFSVVERFERPVVVDQHDRLSVPGLLVTAHSRRIRRHSRKRNTHRFRPCLQQSHHGAYRDVALNYISIDEGCVTRTRVHRHTHLCLEHHKVRIFLNVDRCSVVL